MFRRYYFLLYLLHARLCRSYLMLPSAVSHEDADVPQLLPVSDSQNDDGPLILTPHILSNNISKARELSKVEPMVPNVNSNSGYFTVNETFNSNVFFWFFPKTSGDWRRAPLLLWLQGGPGCSSMSAVFDEHGPFQAAKNATKRRKYSWTNEYNIIYLDQPVGSGFSFTNSSTGYIHSQEQAAEHLYEALNQFYQLYPELRQNEFYIAGESYAGKYITAIAFKIHTEKIAGKCNINLNGLFFISALIDGNGSQNGLGDFCFQIGIIDSQTKDHMKQLEAYAESYIHSGMWKNASQMRNDIFSSLRGNAHIQDYLYYPNIYSHQGDEEYLKFLQSADTKKKIHVGNVKFQKCSPIVYQCFEEDTMKSVTSWLEKLLDYYRVAFVVGQYDLIAAYPLLINVLDKLNWSGALKYRSANRSMIYDGKRLAGYHKSGGNLTDVLLRHAGHMVPANQPRVALDLLKKFVNKKL